MFSLRDGKPCFYIGKINGIGYTNEEERQSILKELDDTEEEIKEEKIELDMALVKKAEEISKKILTYSKSEFEEYLLGKKEIPEELQKENEALKKSSQMSLMTIMQLDKRVIELEKKINELSE